MNDLIKLLSEMGATNIKADLEGDAHVIFVFRDKVRTICIGRDGRLMGYTQGDGTK